MIPTHGLTHIALAVADLDRATTFYRRVFGMVEVFCEEGFVQLQTPDARDIMVLELDPERAGKAGGVRHFGFRLRDPADLDAAAVEILAAGGTILLAKVTGLHVVSRTSAFAFKGKLEDIRAIGRRLQVRTVLEGSIRRAGRRLRLSAQLINVADGYLLWSDTYDRDAEDGFAIQDEISRAIAGALRVKLFGEQQAMLVKPPTDDLEAYTLYLKGRHFWNRRTDQDLQRGLEYFEQALARDPKYAMAHAGVADSYAILGFYSVMPPTEAFSKAKAAALTALALQPDLAAAHPALAYVAMYYDWDWAAAEREFRLAIRPNPGYATAHQWYGNFLVDARSVLVELTQLRAERYVSAYDFAVIHLGLGDSSSAAHWLERAFEEWAHQMAWIKVDPRLDPLRGTASFDRLLERMKLADLTPVA
jgi:catechol 2,3-dioxygenase-like lactoylglutathione lyase family enzyme